jgi:hypothetical protein
VEHSNDVRVIFRSIEPSKLDTANYKTLCRVANDTFYIQLSQDAENPKWEYIGKMDSELILLRLIDLVG